MFTAEVPKDALRAHAAARGLAYEEEGLLPPIASVLRTGLGVGTHMAGLLTDHGGGLTSARGGFTRRPERVTFNLCRGQLAAGLDGAVLAHHQHLELRTSGEDSWAAVVDTVVVARLPERNRAVCALHAKPGSQGHEFRLERPEPQATLDELTGPAVRGALAAAGPDTHAELVDGVLCVWIAGIVEDAERLDALCAAAGTLAAAVRRVVAAHGELDPTRPLPPPPPTEHQRRLDEGVARVDWSQPPSTIADARAAYTPLVTDRARHGGRVVRWWVLGAGLAASALWVGASILFARLTDDALALLAAPFGFLWGIYQTVKIAFDSEVEWAADEVAAQVNPWALEAFARGYARVRGLTVEDPDALRHRLPSPLAGRPLRAMHGDLGGGVLGHLALWRDWQRDVHWLVAVVAAPAGGGEPRTAAPWQASRVGGLLVVGRQVTDAERGAAMLDALAAEAQRLATAA